MKREKEQEKLLVCKPCGYVMKESELRDVCPACGLPRQVFVEYKDKMSPRRRWFLQLDLHPIAIHFPQSVLVFSLLALILNLMLPNFYPEVLIGAVIYTAVVFPFTVFAGFISGLVDGKMRFKTVTAPILKKKIIYSSIMFIASLFTPFLALNGIEHIKTKLLLLLCGTIALVCGIALGHAGKRLMNIGMRGYVKIWGWKI